LTDVYSRRWWFELASVEFSRSRRYGHRFSLILLDLDRFKHVNDSFGHEGGDKLLRAFADMLRTQCRQSDVVGRLGGEEFAIIVPETRLMAAPTLADRIRNACRQLSVSTAAGDITCSCSVGVSELTPDDDSVDSVLRRADAALYEAKRTGRDRVACSPELSPAVSGSGLTTPTAHLVQTP
jgi:diguanylate cyclase (GGDEF)-like protein